MKPDSTTDESLARHWTLEPGLAFLNHGSFGACPGVVLERQQRLRDEMERQPVDFFVRRLPERLDAARAHLAAFVGADPEALAFVPNATTGVNAVLRSVTLEPGTDLLTTDHAYNACRNALIYAAERAGGRVVVVDLPFPCDASGRILEKLLGAVTPRTRLALVDHVTSATGLVLPLAEIVRELAARGVDALVDGAHAPGMLPLELERLGAAYYTGNCHKWICAPKGAGFLYTREDRRGSVRPLTISHGANTRRPGRSRYHDEFDWVGTDDPTAALCVPEAIEFMGALLPGGWPAIRARNRALALEARNILAAALDVPHPCPDEMIGSLAALPLPDATPEPPPPAPYNDPLQETLRRQDRIEVPVFSWPAPPRRLVRISAQLYNRREQYERLAAALRLRLSR